MWSSVGSWRRTVKWACLLLGYKQRGNTVSKDIEPSTTDNYRAPTRRQSARRVYGLPKPHSSKTRTTGSWMALTALVAVAAAPLGVAHSRPALRRANNKSSWTSTGQLTYMQNPAGTVPDNFNPFSPNRRASGPRRRKFHLRTAPPMGSTQIECGVPVACHLI